MVFGFYEGAASDSFWASWADLRKEKSAFLIYNFFMVEYEQRGKTDIITLKELAYSLSSINSISSIN